MLPELLQEIVESGALDELIRERIEHELYVLAGQDKIGYEPDSGWKLARRQRRRITDLA